MDKHLKIGQILYIIMIIAIIIYADLLFRIMPRFDVLPILSSSNSTIFILIFMLGVFAICCIIFGYIWPAFAVKHSKSSMLTPLTLVIMRCALFESVGIYGLVLGLLGADWKITLMFLLVSALFLVITFPTNKSWSKLKELIETRSQD